jgi:hypothetical protein
MRPCTPCLDASRRQTSIYACPRIELMLPYMCTHVGRSRRDPRVRACCWQDGELRDLSQCPDSMYNRTHIYTYNLAGEPTDSDAFTRIIVVGLYEHIQRIEEVYIYPLDAVAVYLQYYDTRLLSDMPLPPLQRQRDPHVPRR